MSRIFVAGAGAVSPSGWSVSAMRASLAAATPLPTLPLERPGWSQPLLCRPVPAPATRPAFLAHPRLRRASPITHYAAGAALEALSPLKVHSDAPGRIGVVVCLDGGCVLYSCRFFEEVLKDPTTASPLLFPETVFAALGSSVAALLPEVPLLYTLIGDSANFLQGVAVAAEWLVEGRVDTALVIGAGEINWVLADALWHLDHTAALSAGAGAIALTRNPALSLGVELQMITRAHTYSATVNRRQAAENVRRELLMPGDGELLCDSLNDNFRTNQAELAVWKNWTGSRVSVRRILGEGLVAAAGWQCVAAVDGILAAPHSAANVSVMGTNEQAIGLRFVKTDLPPRA